MTLPTINTELRHTLKLPITGDTITFRPFFVKEEKILMMALENDSAKNRIQAIKNVVDNCTFGELNTSELPMVDLEWIFLNLRIKSKGETSQLSYKCKSEKCNHSNNIDVDLTKINVKTHKDHNSVIQITQDIGIKMKYPSLMMVDNIDGEVSGDNINQNMSILIDSIDSIFEGETVYNAVDVSREELQEFVETMTDVQFEKIKEFFNTMPKLSTTIHIKCSECGTTEDILVEGIQNFFG